MPENLRNANISFMTYQDFDNFCEDRLFAWEQYQAAAAKHTAFANASVSFLASTSSLRTQRTEISLKWLTSSFRRTSLSTCHTRLRMAPGSIAEWPMLL